MKITKDTLHQIGAAIGIFFVLYACNAIFLVKLSEGGWK